MQLNKLTGKVKTYWSLFNIIWVIVVAVAYFTTIVACEFNLVVVISVGVPALLLEAFLIAYPLLKYACYSYGYDEERIVVKYGVIFRHSVTIPVCQIQDLHTFEGPIMHIFGLSGITFSTAGSNFNLACVQTSDAERIVDELEKYLNVRVKELQK